MVKTISGNYDVDSYLEKVLSGKPYKTCTDLKKLARIVIRAFKTEKLYIDDEKYKSYIKIGEAMFETLFDWQRFLVVLMLCTFTEDGHPRWKDLLCMIGRGGGKDGFIAWISLCMVSANNEIAFYDVDICANNEDQAMRPIRDINDFLNNPEYININRNSFYWTKTIIRGLQNKGYIKGHTNSPKGKDGLRSGSVIFNEIHQYEEYENINVFFTGLGKKPHPRTFMFTTNGDVRDGVLDHYLAKGESILNEEVDDRGFLPFICRLDNKNEVHDKSNWVKANPSLPYLPDLMKTIEDQYHTWKQDPMTLPAFMTKRMNLPESASENDVVDYEYIKKTNKPLANLYGKRCIVGIDTSIRGDFTSVSAIFRVGQENHVINHTWVCVQSKDYARIKFKGEFPNLVNQGLITMVDEHEISPLLICEYIQELKRDYVIQKVAIDDFKYSIYERVLRELGFSRELKNLKLVRPSDIARIIPVIESKFKNELFVWGDNKMLRWATNNTKVIPWKRSTTGNNDLGNKLYAKKEAKSRKTDPFMSLVHAMTCESELVDYVPIKESLRRVRTY